MTDSTVMQIAIDAIMTAAKLAAPILLVTMTIGLLISLIQAATQVQEVTLTFVPKLGGIAAVLVLAGNWMIAELIAFTHRIFHMLPQMLGN
jgi:flagellar biosynthetic protein FliQ